MVSSALVCVCLGEGLVGWSTGSSRYVPRRVSGGVYSRSRRSRR
jgi:hypothetical protein